MFFPPLRPSFLSPLHPSFLPPSLPSPLPPKEPCNGQGTCSCEGMCQCNPSYTGRYCETFIPPPTSANFTQAIQNCNDGRECAECALDIISQFEESTEEFFMINPTEDSRLPEGTQLVTDLHENTIGFQLPAGFCRSRNCSHTVVIINGTNDRAGYDITSKHLSGHSRNAQPSFKAFSATSLLCENRWRERGCDQKLPSVYFIPGYSWSHLWSSLISYYKQQRAGRGLPW